MATLKEIRQQGQKSYSSFHRRVLHEMGFFITWVFVRLPFTPNQITLFWMAWQFASCFLLLQGTYLTILLGVFLFQFGTVIDCVDGQVARFRKETSLMGVYLDQFAHNILNPLFFLFLSIGVAKQQGNPLYLYVGILGILFFWHTRILAANILWFRPEYRQIALKHFDSYSLRNNWIWIYDSLKIEYLFNLLFFGVLLGYAHVMIILYTILFGVDFFKRTIFQFVKVHAVDKEVGPGAKGGLG